MIGRSWVVLRMERENHPHQPKMAKSSSASRKMLYRWSYLRSLPTQVPEAMQMQHRETDRRQLRETLGKIFQTGFSHLRKDWRKENLDHAAVLVKPFPKHFLHISQRDFRTNLEGNTRLQQFSSKILKGTTQQSIISTPDKQCTSHLSALMVSCSRNTEFQRQSRSCISSIFYQDFAKVMASTRELSRFGGGPMDQSYLESSGIKKDNLKYVRRAHRRLQVAAEGWLVQNVGRSKDSTSVNCQIRQTAFERHHHPAKVTRTTSVMEPPFIEPTSVTTSPKQVHQTEHYHGRMNQFDHGKVVGNIVNGSIPKIHAIKQCIKTHGEMPNEHVSAK